MWQTERQTDGRTHDDSKYRASIARCAVGRNESTAYPFPKLYDALVVDKQSKNRHNLAELNDNQIISINLVDAHLQASFFVRRTAERLRAELFDETRRTNAMTTRRLFRLPQYLATRAAAVRGVHILDELRQRVWNTVVAQRREDARHQSEACWTQKRGSGRSRVTEAHTKQQPHVVVNLIASESFRCSNCRPWYYSTFFLPYPYLTLHLSLQFGRWFSTSVSAIAERPTRHSVSVKMMCWMLYK